LGLRCSTATRHHARDLGLERDRRIEVDAPSLAPAVVPITIAILVACS